MTYVIKLPFTIVDFDAPNSANLSIILALRLRDCNTSWTDISHVGELYSLLEVEMILTSQPLFVQETISNQLPGLSDVGFISINILNSIIKLSLHSILPYENVSMKSVGSLEVQCYSESITANRVYCDRGTIAYQPSLLQLIFPHLQTLSLGGVYPQDTGSNLSFPWDESNKKLPLNLSESRLNQELPNDKTHLKLRGIFSRSYAIVNNIGLNVSNFCPFHRPLNVIILGRNALRNIPSDCFTPSSTELSTLQILDLSRNDIVKFQYGIFDRLESLEVLHAPDCKLKEVQTGLFDDLVRLKVLNLDKNAIQSLGAGLFSKLKSLEELYLHNNNISHMEHQTLPIYSLNLVMVDLRWNRLKDLPADCFTLPNLYACDCRMNEISLKNLMNTVAQFDPIKMAMVEPLAYYGQSYSRIKVGGMHQTAQTTFSLVGNKVKTIEFNNSWSS